MTVRIAILNPQIQIILYLKITIVIVRKNMNSALTISSRSIPIKRSYNKIKITEQKRRQNFIKYTQIKLANT